MRTPVSSNGVLEVPLYLFPGDVCLFFILTCQALRNPTALHFGLLSTTDKGLVRVSTAAFTPWALAGGRGPAWPALWERPLRRSAGCPARSASPLLPSTP